MKIFLSYATEDRNMAELIYLALEGADFEVFFDRSSLPGGGEYNLRIQQAIADSDAFVFLISPDSVAAGRFTLAELKFAREKWTSPRDRVFPVMVRKTDLASLPGGVGQVVEKRSITSGHVAHRLIANLLVSPCSLRKPTRTEAL